MKTLEGSKVFVFLFLVFIRSNEEGKWVQDFLLLSQSIKVGPSKLPWARWGILKCVECLQMIKSLVLGLCSIDCDATPSMEFENTCTVSGKWNVSRVIPRLFEWKYKTIRIFLLAVELSVVDMIACSQSRWSQIES